MSTPNKHIPTNEWIERATSVLELIAGKQVLPARHVTELFLLHNDRIRPEEFGRHCSSCVTRVINRTNEELISLKSSLQDNGSNLTDSPNQDEDPQDITEH